MIGMSGAVHAWLNCQEDDLCLSTGISDVPGSREIFFQGIARLRQPKLHEAVQ